MTRAAIYLDHNAASPLLPEARAALVAGLDLTGNASSVHGHGRALRNLIDTARGQVAALAGAERKQVVFTGSATEAITQAIVGGARAFASEAIVISAGEHAAVSKAAEMTGLPVITIGLLADGSIDLDQLAECLQHAGGNLLVALHWVNNETGVVQDMARINALVGPTRHTLFIDAVQAFGKLPLDFAASAPDMMAVSGHKIGAPAGIGALLVKAHADVVRLIPGGGQEQGRRGGTEAAALIAAFGAAASAIVDRYTAANVPALIARLEAALPGDAVVFGGERLGNVVNFAVPGVKNATAMMGLDLMGLSVSSGSACSSGKVGPSHVLAAMGVAPELAECALRVSLGWNSTSDDVDAFVAGYRTILERQRARQGQAA
ncbi:MAG: aminotransferase class V-fold PLP-dependent enzyme [Alphaproteobacteria bacterium]|nr:aminotransferase class V-fold PLP-dependent enzyme [Alphaproteobacteria bacterium]MBU1560914.1 aminotransferase class V-fold PLP-dependent enzyme [Alphaproteobacteria bacterium]MBU2304888.1 aminotransferase class V-fold PLP-dependent enzyme [Alphaproteobacteria bacterium]MBU2370139.1 aminotransferase class V-fold PLP-dependent enzyme [Alphaproteobacteria bacterium]